MFDHLPSFYLCILLTHRLFGQVAQRSILDLLHLLESDAFKSRSGRNGTKVAVRVPVLEYLSVHWNLIIWQVSCFLHRKNVKNHECELVPNLLCIAAFLHSVVYSLTQLLTGALGQVAVKRTLPLTR